MKPPTNIDSNVQEKLGCGGYKSDEIGQSAPPRPTCKQGNQIDRNKRHHGRFIGPRTPTTAAAGDRR
jgi:hypothetical protein